MAVEETNMKICRFNEGRIGLVRDDAIHDITAEAAALMAQVEGVGDPFIRCLDALAREIAPKADQFPVLRLQDVALRAPVAAPGKIVAAPVNYQAHIFEMQASNISPGHNIPDIARAGLFLKATSSLVGAGDGIAIRFPQRRTDHEIELVAIIGATASNVTEERALDHVAGYCMGLDITLRGTEDRSFRKSIDSYSVLGPWLTTRDEIADPDALTITLQNNGDHRQTAETSDLLFGVRRLIAFASSFYTLYPGDVLYTGTPQGVGPIVPGDRLLASCPELGTMSVAVRAFAA